MSPILKTLQKKITPFAINNGISNLSVFGSYSRGDNKKNSDIDLLVTFSDRITLLDLIDIEMKLSKLLKKKVDLVTPGAVSELLRESIEKDLKVLYEKR